DVQRRAQGREHRGRQRTARLRALLGTVARRILSVLGLILLGLVIAGVTVWGALVLFYLAPGPESVRKTLAWIFAAIGRVTIAGLVVRRVRWPAFVAFAAGLVLVVVAWNSVKPSNDRDWQTEGAGRASRHHPRG